MLNKQNQRQIDPSSSRSNRWPVRWQQLLFQLLIAESQSIGTVRNELLRQQRQDNKNIQSASGAGQGNNFQGTIDPEHACLSGEPISDM